MEIDGLTIAVMILVVIVVTWMWSVWWNLEHINMFLHDIKDLLEEERKDRVNKQRRQV